MTVQDRIPRRVMLQATVVLAAVAAAVAPTSPWAVERWFSTGIYLRLQRILTPVSSAIPVAWLDLLSLGAACGLIWLWVRTLRETSQPLARRLARASWSSAVAAAFIYLVFLGLWGLNYRRTPLASRLVVDANPPSDADVAALGHEAATHVNALYSPAHSTGWAEPVWRNEALRRAFADVQSRLADAPIAAPGRLKRTVFGPFFRWTGVDGMVNPFGLEVVANPDLLPFERPFVTAHEWAHLAGYADESEANFAGWLTCLGADVPSQYSGWLYLYWQVAGELHPDAREVLGKTLNEGPKRDLSAIVARLRRGDLPLLRRASWVMYDRFLKANRVEAGVRSYGAVVTLILRTRFENGRRPVRRASPQSP